MAAFLKYNLTKVSALSVKMCFSLRTTDFRSLEEEPWAHKVEITTECLTENRVECRSCQDSCPMNAIRFRLQLGGVAKPILDLEKL